ncbi:related to WHI2 - growth regulation protein [Melanopsichium pennsylvanicum]|uniref:Related to WHI2 - growth regulation protein n=2 Tax=Melanopsichium pennsylvanicum TaxID=63383 RepID=A0AAJ4XKK5_9BASI|nr:related to WHI2-growth regulation protein [Melanopsichium pennsylvanicum 4]SNX83676.1 related to WHI2 - growth regulation protein [Melanopsichium pennsylvanicum]
MVDTVDDFYQQDPSTHLTLELRGTRFTIERETMMNLPESVLLCLFPNGLILTRQPRIPSLLDQEGEEDEEELYLVDFDPQCLSYVLSFFKTAQDEFYGTSELPGKYRPSSSYGSPGLYHFAQASGEGADPNQQGGLSQIPLMNKQPIIVLREELEYFAIPPKKAAAGVTSIDPGSLEGTDPATGHPTPALLRLKSACGDALLDRKQIFTALQRNVNKENNLAEQHLIDMLCMSGFDREDAWGFRALEPNRCCITSIALVLLKTGITHAGELEAEGINPESLGANEYHDPSGQTSMVSNMRVDHQQFATAQKLLLFWRKPARKCWWDGIDIVLPASGEDAQSEQTVRAEDLNDASLTAKEVELLKSGKGRKVRVWARRVWTLELSLI